MSLWQEADLKETKGLAPCAFLTIWNVRNAEVDGVRTEYLDMCLIQRSGDMLTASGAGCMNEVQYAALLMMIARHCGYEAGVFTHFVANEQIYDRHTEQADVLLDRFYETERDEYFGGEKPYPKLVLNSDAQNFFEMTIDDFTMVNYNPKKPQLTLDLGI